MKKAIIIGLVVIIIIISGIGFSTTLETESTVNEIESDIESISPVESGSGTDYSIILEDSIALSEP